MWEPRQGVRCILRTVRPPLPTKIVPPPSCISYALVQATVGVGTVLIWDLILIRYQTECSHIRHGFGDGFASRIESWTHVLWVFAHLNPHSSDFVDVCAFYTPFLHQVSMQSSLFEPVRPVLVVVCVARKLRPCPGYSRRTDRINLGHWRSL